VAGKTGVRRDVVRLLLDPRSANTLDSLPCRREGCGVELLIGAEGGLSPEEMEMALQAGFTGVRLGPRDSAHGNGGLAALAAIQCLWGDFRGEADHV
jgi:16S rRNA (uracil1498-N3)-methyltransferase